MLSEYEFITHKFPDRQDIRIYVIVDVHLGAKEHLEREWNQFCDNILKDENARIILAGDLINNGLKSSVSNVYEETMRPREQKRVMTEMLRPLKDRILCATTGNHERRSGKDADDDPTYDIMCKLDLEHLYRENMAFVKLLFGDTCRGDGKRNPAYVLAVTHGAGGGFYTGSSVNKAENFAYIFDGIDALVVGHCHKPFETYPEKIKVDAHHNKIYPVPIKVICGTSWLAYGGYAMQKMLRPASHVKQVMTIRGKKKEISIETT